MEAIEGEITFQVEDGALSNAPFFRAGVHVDVSFLRRIVGNGLQFG